MGQNNREEKFARYQRLFSGYSKQTLDQFKVYHEQNPQIFDDFRSLAIKMKQTGRRYYSAKMIINVLRWETDLRAQGDEFKINDRFQSLYGRLLAYNDPSFEEFFEFRVVGKNRVNGGSQ